MSRLKIAGLYILGLIAFTGCSIKYSFTGASIPQGAKTVSVQTIPNMAPLINPMLSMTLTEALKDKFMSQTSLQLIQREGDLRFEGTITGYDTRPMAIQSSDVAAMNRLTITVKIKYSNGIDPKADFETTFSAYEDYDSSLQLQEVEDGLTQEIVDKLVEDIFNKAVVNW